MEVLGANKDDMGHILNASGYSKMPVRINGKTADIYVSDRFRLREQLNWITPEPIKNGLIALLADQKMGDSVTGVEPYNDGIKISYSLPGTINAEPTMEIAPLMNSLYELTVSYDGLHKSSQSLIANIGLVSAMLEKQHGMLTQTAAVEEAGRDSASGVAVAVKPEQVIEEISGATKQLTTLMAMNDSPMDLSKIAIVMKKDLAQTVTGDKGAVVGETLKTQYQQMKQNLSKVFQAGGGVLEVSTQEELADTVNSLIGQGLKVVVLDDGSFGSNMNTAGINGKSGDQYCVVSSEIMKDLETGEVPFVNFNAMALMGVSILDKNDSLFKFAYKTFTGSDASEDMITQLMTRALWFVKVLPRIVKFAADDINNAEIIRRIFAVAA